MKLLLPLLLLLISPGVLAAPLPEMFAPPAVPVLRLPALLPLPLPPAHQPGDLARDRLRGMDALVLSSNQVSVERLGQPNAALPSTQAKAVLKCLSDLVLDDALYTEDAAYDMSGFNTSNSEVLVTGKLGHSVAILIRRDKPWLTIMQSDYDKMVITNDLPVLPKVVKLLRAVDPDGPGLNMALVTVPPPLPDTENVPASVLTRIATLKPGMTRADVMRLFTTEGGISTTYWNHYLYCNTVPLPGKPSDPMMVSFPGKPSDPKQILGGFIKVNVDFAPQDADIDWLGGRGFWLHQNDYGSQHKTPNYWGNPNDIVLNVSPPYVQGMIVD